MLINLNISFDKKKTNFKCINIFLDEKLSRKCFTHNKYRIKETNSSSIARCSNS